MNDRDISWEAYWRGYRDARGVESVDPIISRTAQTLFDRWWELNGK